MVFNSIFPIDIPKRSQACAKGQEALQSGATYYSLLVEEKEQGQQRRDYCAKCWETVAIDDDFLKSKIYWKSRVPSKKEEPQLPQDRDERAFVLLKTALEESNNPEAFVLALYLARKRLISLRKEFNNDKGQVQQLYEVLETEEMLCVNKVPLSSLQIVQIQTQLAKKMLS